MYIQVYLNCFDCPNMYFRWQKTVHGGEVNECDGTVEDVEEAVMVPEFPGGWLSVDGEEYEFLAMTITLKHNALTLFSE